MPPKKRAAAKRSTPKRPRRARVVAGDLDMEGGSFLGDLWEGAKKVGKWIVDNKAISKTANALGFNNVGNIAGMVGLGRPPRVVPKWLDDQMYKQSQKMVTQGGGAWYHDAWDKFKKAHNWVRDNRVISKGLKAFGNKKWAGIVGQAGYGAQSGGAAVPMVDNTMLPGLLGV